MSVDARSMKRTVMRKRVQMAVTVLIEGEEAEYLGTTVDLSPYGLRLKSDATLAPGQPVGLVLATQTDCLIKARVAWVGKAESAQAGEAGFEFSAPLKGPDC